MTTTDAATFCATLVDEWARADITDAFVAPGSRSTPLALALAEHDEINVHVFHDERAASFAALGHGLVAGIPAVALCTSGTAAAHFHAAVIEADLSSVPIIVCTADRPPELWDIGAPQTMDQRHLFGSAVRFYAEPGAPEAAVSSWWRSFASRAVAEAVGWSSRPGPVHLNLSFRDPLVGEPGPLPVGRGHGQPWHRLESSPTSVPAADAASHWPTLVEEGRAVSGVIIAGAGTADASAVLTAAARLGWPVLADHRSGCRHGPAAIAHFDALLRSDGFAQSARPKVVVRFGEALASKVLSQWLAGLDAHVVTVIDRGRWSDPERSAGTVVVEPDAAGSLLRSIPADAEPSTALDRWRRADDCAAGVIAGVLDDDLGTDAALGGANTALGGTDAALGGAETAGVMGVEIAVARRMVEVVPADGVLVVGSSMPVRDVEWYGPRRDDIIVVANRGANGIDGTVATGIGAALTGRPTTVLAGDVAFLHDSAALIGLAGRPVDLRLVVINNDGGGIFSFLPQAELLDGPTYEQLFGTPHGTDLAALATAHGLRVVDSLSEADPRSQSGVRVTIVRSDRVGNAAVHRRINDSIVDALETC